MKMYQVIVSSNLPYPIPFTYQIKATNLHTAVYRAAKNYRKEPRVARKRIDNLTIRLGAATI